MTIETPRLRLHNTTIATLEAALRGRADLARALGVHVPTGWPPELLDDDGLRWTINAIRTDPARQPWLGYFVVLRSAAGAVDTLIGMAGYKGPPADGGVEIGYGILDPYRRQGFATEAARGLIGNAFAHPAVVAVYAETYPELAPSIGVLEKCGFRRIGDGSEPRVIRFRLDRPTG